MLLCDDLALARSLPDGIVKCHSSRPRHSAVAFSTSASSRTGDRPSSASAQLFRHDCANCSVRAPSASVCACQFFNNLIVRKRSIIFKVHLSHSHSRAHAIRTFPCPSHDTGLSAYYAVQSMPDLILTARAEASRHSKHMLKRADVRTTESPPAAWHGVDISSHEN